MMAHDRLNELGSAALIMYCLRHQESVMNVFGYGDKNTPLTQKGKKRVSDLTRILNSVGVESIEAILTGTLPRHTETTRMLADSCGYKGSIIYDEKLNATSTGPIIEAKDKRKVEEQHALSRFTPGDDSLYHASVSGKTISFDPAKEQIFPLGLYPSFFVDKRLRSLAFGDNDPLTHFSEIEKKARDFHARIIDEYASKDELTRLVCVGSCSALASIYELALYNTIGENTISYLQGEPEYGEEKIKSYYEGIRLYPQEHNQIAILYLKQQDFKEGKDRLRFLGQSIRDIDEFIKGDINE